MTDRTCDIDGCDREHLARGWCSLHYARWLKHDDPLGGGGYRGEPLIYFLAHVDDQTDDCILWPYGGRGNGYGTLWTNGNLCYVHVLACEHGHGPKPDGHQVCHSCRNRHCFNPHHLRWGTPAENEADKIRDGTVQRGENHCWSKLTEVDVLSIRARYAAGSHSYRDIAAMYAVDPTTIYKIVLRKRWAHI